MADRKITDLTALTTPVSGDLLPIVDISEASAASKNKKITYSDFLNNIPTGTITSTMILDGTILNADINASAAIVDTKLATIATGGKVSGTAITSGNISTSGSFTSTSTVTGTNLIPTGSGVPTNGIYLPAANSVAVATNGTQKLLIDSGGRLTQTGNGLGINFNGYSDITFTDPVSGNNAYLLTYAPGQAVFLGSNNGASFVYGWGSANTTHIFHTGSSAERLRITSAGLVGIGTSSPSNKLDVVGVTQVYDSRGTSGYDSLKFIGGSAVDFPTIEAVSATSPLHFKTNSNVRMAITSTGLVGIGVTGPQAIFHSKAGATTSAGIFESTSASGSFLSFADTGTNSYTRVQVGSVGNELVLRTSDQERCRVDTSGRLLIGTSSNLNSNARCIIQSNTDSATGPAALDLRLGTTRPAAADTTIGLIRFSSTSQTAASNVYAQISAASDGASSSDADIPGRLVFSVTSNSASSPTERLRITSTGQVRLAGAGITFNGDTATANELDDYEEGTWTPALANSSGTTITASIATGKYTKVGNLVTIYVYIFNITGAFQTITGLPYTYWDGHAAVGRILSADGGNNTAPNADGVDLLLTQGGTQLKMNTNNFSSSSNIWLTLTYRAS